MRLTHFSLNKTDNEIIQLLNASDNEDEENVLELYIEKKRYFR